MNIATTTERPAFATQAPLRDKVALVTGSTSGIGLGIARALAAAGAAIVLNGFGKQDEIEATQQAIGADFGVPVAYSAADMSKPDSIAEMPSVVIRNNSRHVSAFPPTTSRTASCIHGKQEAACRRRASRKAVKEARIASTR